MIRPLSLAALIALASCGAASPAATTAVNTVATVAQLASAAGVPGASTVVALGELFCGSAGQISAMVTSSNKIVSVIGKDAATVASYCPAGWAPVSPPANPGATPTVVSTTAPAS